jgi:uncharacterized protein (TIGR03435 family)
LSRHDCSRLFLTGNVSTVVIALVSLTARVLIALLHTPTIHAQSASAAARKPAFDVVSIRPNESGDHFWSQSPLQNKVGRYRATNATLSALISDYFGLKNESQIVGGPRWLGTERFDIQAQVDGEPSRQELIRMVQSLMEDRFQLRFHRDSRETPVYVLLAPKNGLTFGSHLAKADDRECPTVPSNDSGCRKVVSVPRGMLMEHVNSASVAQTLSSMLRQVVVDETGLTGRYDIKLDYDLTPPDTGTAIPFGDLVVGALRTQTGLRLETQKRLLDVLVIDHVEMPSGN